MAEKDGNGEDSGISSRQTGLRDDQADKSLDSSSSKLDDDFALGDFDAEAEAFAQQVWRQMLTLQIRSVLTCMHLPVADCHILYKHADIY